MYTWVIFFPEYIHQSVTFNWQVTTREGGGGEGRRGSDLQQFLCHPFNFLQPTFNQYTHTIVELDEHNFKKEMIKVLPQRCISTTFSLHFFFSFAFMVKQTIEESAPWVRWSSHSTPKCRCLTPLHVLKQWHNKVCYNVYNI